MLQTSPGVREAPITLPGTTEKDPTRPRADRPPPEGMSEPLLDVDNIQGNILAGFNKDHQTHLYLRINSPRDAATVEAFRAWLGRLVPFVATTNEVLRFNRLFKEIRRRRCVESRAVMATWINVALSFEALRLLAGDGEDLAACARRLEIYGGADSEHLRAEAFTDAAFKEGMPRRAVKVLSDPENEALEGNPKNWTFGREGEEPDMVVIVASDSASELAAEVARIEDGIYGGRPGHDKFGSSGVSVVYKQHGNTLPPPLTGHEHFGFLDGVSQPGIRGVVSRRPFDLLTPRQNPTPDEHLHQGKPGQDLLWPGEFVFGYPGQDHNAPPGDGPDEGIHKAGPNSLTEGGPVGGWAGPVWAKDGAFLVVRRLRQEVERFHNFLHREAPALHLTDDELGAKLVGRWKSGAPILRVDQDNPALGNDDCANNHFEFASPSSAILKSDAPPGSGLCADERDPQSQGDTAGQKCPFGGHIRKAYPRDDAGNPGQPFEKVDEITTQTHRLLRRGIPFGDPFYPAPGVDTDNGNRGLLFACYQTSIVEQFEFVTQRWVNNPQFKDQAAQGNPESGHDLILGQSNQGGSRARHCRIDVDGKTHVLQATAEDEWVIPTGGGYFFAPSLDALCLLTATPAQQLSRKEDEMAYQGQLRVQPVPSREPACIVPLRQEEAAQAGAAILPLEYHGGPLLANVEVFTVFWGAAWQQPPLAGLATQLNEFFTFIVTSPLIDQLGEYSAPGFDIGQGSFVGTTTVDLPLPAVLPDDQVQQLLQEQIAGNASFPAPTPNTLYFIFLPPDVVSDLHGDRSCVQQCGYHESIGGGIFYALIPHATCQGCTRGFSLFESLTRVASHELCEAITDPNGDGWFTSPPDGSAGEEIGDLCSEGTKQVGPYTVQTEFSNQQGTCV